jgi:predicted aconitase/predicted aconitase with swiveling domain
MIQLNDEQQAMLNGELGLAKQMGMRLLLDLAATARATQLVPIQSAHLSGVSPLTGGLGLRQFLTRLLSDPDARVAVPTTLNSAGCDESLFEAMRITVPDFLQHNHEIVQIYSQLGVQPIQSCVPYEWEGVVTSGTAAWAESNAICFGNSYCELRTNRESGLSALASALTGYTPHYGLLDEVNRRPNLAVVVTAKVDDPTDFSILGDWIGKQQQPGGKMPYGPIPAIKGLPTDLTHEQKKALAAAAANYGCPLLYIDGLGPRPPADFQAKLLFDEATLQARYSDLYPYSPISLIAIGCPQASIGELRAVAQLLKGKRLPSHAPPLWVFTSAASKAIAEQTGLAGIIRDSGALLLQNTCPEVVPYDPTWVKHILTNSMKAEHYIKSGLNGIPTSVMRLADCIAVAMGEWRGGDVEEQRSRGAGERRGEEAKDEGRRAKGEGEKVPLASHPSLFTGYGLPSQGDFTITGEAFVTDVPITLLGFVNRETGVIEEPGHPADGRSMAGKIAIFPKGSGSSVAPYVLLELFYRGLAPLAIVNSAIDQQTAPACSLEGIPYAYGFDGDVMAHIQNGDQVELKRVGNLVTIQVL